MFRKVANRLKGRKLVKDESLEFEGVLKLLQGLDKTTTIIPSYFRFGTSIPFENMYKNDAIKLLEEELHPLKTDYFEANHQVYKGKKDEKHYINIKIGPKKDQTLSRFLREANKEANLEYRIANKI